MMTYYWNSIRYLGGQAGGWWYDRYPSSVSFGVWNHYAVSRQSGTTRIFLNGSQVDAFGDGTNYTNVNQTLRVGGRTLGDQWFNGYIDEVRVTKGKARYTNGFSPGNVAFSNDACYTAGVERSCARQDFACAPTGYCAGTTMYYIDGVEQPGLNSSGTGISAVDNKYYVNGVLAEGVAQDAKTVLLLHMDGYHGSRDFTDSSASPKSASVFGETYINTYQSKFGGGSAYFDGSGDYLSFSSPTDFALGTGDFTAELWFNQDYNWWCGGCGPSDRALLTTADPVDSDGFLMLTYYSSTLRFLAGQAAGWMYDRWLGGIGTGTWYHYAVSRQSGTTKIFLNGSQIDSFGDSTNYTNVNQALKVGGRAIGDQSFYGYIDEVRVIKGKARYTDSFSPPSVAFNDQACYTAGVERTCGYQEFACAATGYCAALSIYYLDGVAHPGLNSAGTGTSSVDNRYYVNGALANGSLGQTVLLLHMDGPHGSKEFTDSSLSNKLANVVGETYINTWQSKFGGGSAYFDGSGDYLSFTSPSDFALGTGDFTAELWFNPEPNPWWCWWSCGSYERALLTTADSTDADGFLMMTSNYYSHLLRYLAGSNLGWWLVDRGYGYTSPGTWNHYAVSRQSGTTRVFLNGTQIDSFGDGTDYTNVNQAIKVGGRSLSDQVFHGYIDEVRVTKGYARYVDSFATPSVAFNASDCYTAGVARSCDREDFACPATGYCAGVNKYYIEGIAYPGLDVSGTGLSQTDNKYYVNGVPAEGLVADNNNILLMHMDGNHGSTTFTDSSSSNRSVTANGSAAITTAQSKFGGASAFLDGSQGADLQVTAGSDFDFGASDFTVEAWVQLSTLNGPDAHHLIMCGSDYGSMCVGFYGNGTQLGFGRRAVQWDLLGAVSVSPGTWYHVAVTRSQGYMRVFLDGALITEGSIGNSYSFGTNLHVGSHNGALFFPGYIDELRITKNVARYTASFTPPTTPFGSTCYTAGVARACSVVEVGCPSTGYCSATGLYAIDGVFHPGINSSGTGFSASDNNYYIGGAVQPGLDMVGTGCNQITGLCYQKGVLANGYIEDKTVLLMHMDGENGATTFTDSSPLGLVVGGNGNAVVSNDESKFGGGSAYFNGAADLTINDSQAFQFGVGDFTVEMWLNVDQSQSSNQYVLDFGSNQAPLQIYNGGGFMGPVLSNYYNSQNSGGQTQIPSNSWVHAAVVRANGTTTLYLGGVSAGSFEDSSVYSGTTLSVGRYGGGGYNLYGYIDELRVTKGVARYTGNFNPPTSAFSLMPSGFYINGVLQANSSIPGSSPGLAAGSAVMIKSAYPSAPNGVYWINLPGSGPTPIYCLMEDKYDGGGWMMMMKATKGTTFNYDASYWTVDNLLNPEQTNTEDGDAKFDVMNKFAATDMMAKWPDISNGGSIPDSTLGWTWLQKNFNDGVPITPISFFSTDNYAMNPGGSGKFIQDAKIFSGWAPGIFSSQADIRFYGFNYKSNPYWGINARVRWGFGWNENGEGNFPGQNTWANGSNDVSGGIGMDSSYGNYSAGDRVYGAQDSTGINRSARVEIYVK